MNSENGQVGLAVLLIMSAMLTLGISAVQNSTSNVRQTAQQLNATDVFYASESGIEAGLRDADNSQIGDFSFTDGDVSVDYSVVEVDAVDVTLAENETIEVDTSSAVAGDLLEITWALGEDCTEQAAALVVSVVDTSAEVITRSGHTKCNRSDGFTLHGPNDSLSVTLSASSDMVRIRSLYNSADLLVDVDPASSTWSQLPVQHHRVVSRGTHSESGEQTLLQVDKTAQTLPSIFDYALVSGGSISL